MNIEVPVFVLITFRSVKLALIVNSTSSFKVAAAYVPSKWVLTAAMMFATPVAGTASASDIATSVLYSVDSTVAPKSGKVGGVYPVGNEAAEVAIVPVDVIAILLLF